MSDKKPKTTEATYTIDPNWKPGTRIIYVREGEVQSILSDIFTFGILIGISTLHFVYWGAHWYMGILIIFLWLVFVVGRAQSKKREFYSRSEVIDTLIKELEAEGETSK